MTRDDKVAYNYARERLDNDDYPVYSDEYELEHAFKAGIEYAKQWISVEDELPVELGWYLIYGASHNGCYWDDVCYWDGNRWWRNVYNITHWMPLPQPPRGIRGNQRKISPNQQQIIGTPEHIKTALDVMDKKGGEK